MPVATSSAGDGGGSDGSALDSSRPGEHDDAMSSPDDRPGPGQSPTPSARAPQAPDPEPSGDPGTGAGLGSGPPGETAPGSGAPGETAPGSGAPGETAPGPGPDAPGPAAPSPRPRQPRPPRSGAELAHFVLVSVLLGTALMGPIQTLAQMLPSQPSPVPLILSSIILNESIWLPVGALVLALRRRPTTLSTALALVTLLDDARYAPFLGTVTPPTGNLAPFVLVYLSLALAVAGAVVGALANRSLDGRPIPVTLAGGVCAGVLTRSAVDLAHRLYQMLDDDAALLLSARQWDTATFLGLIDVPPDLIPVLTAVAAVAAAVGLTGFWSARGARSRTRLLAGALAAAVVTIVLAGLLPTSSSALNDSGFGFSPLTALTPTAPVLLLMSGLVALPACGRWFEQRR
ncbi:hypothetical protein [Actinomyces sp. oral taxon 414]|uniref:hypothetical protein n=1 Tax=Actinomyces sp. oral taxon 414 TaxID=712122 RepID=UPI00155DCC44|nr:hypothetical protein [Actinomyces sp. oral taxon 414]